MRIGTLPIVSIAQKDTMTDDFIDTSAGMRTSLKNALFMSLIAPVDCIAHIFLSDVRVLDNDKEIATLNHFRIVFKFSLKL
jgi:hypothetical protein